MLSRIKTSITDSIILINIYLKKRLHQQPKQRTLTSFQDILLQEANEKNNSIAAFLLKVKREYNLVQYDGLSTYMHKNINVMKPLRGIIYESSSTSTLHNNTPKDLESDDKVQKTKAKKATIAFMITSNQKQQLKDILGYDTIQIKKLTPLQASLIIQNHILPENIDQVQKLVQEFHREEGEKKKNDISSMLDNDKDDANTWYEVVEIIHEIQKESTSTGAATTSESVISLYRTKEEALVCLDIKQEAVKTQYNDKDLSFKYQVRKRK